MLTHDQKPLLNEHELATLLNVSLGTIRRWRLFKLGPPYKKIGALVRYDVAEVRQWLANRPSGGQCA